MTQWASPCTFCAELLLGLRAVPCRQQSLPGKPAHPTRGRPACNLPEDRTVGAHSSAPAPTRSPHVSPPLGRDRRGMQAGARRVSPGNESPHSSERVSIPGLSPERHLRNSSEGVKGWGRFAQDSGSLNACQAPFPVPHAALALELCEKPEFLKRKKMILRQELMAPKEMTFQQHPLYQFSAAAV